MPKYLITGGYTQAGIKGVLAEGGSRRREAVEELAQSVGGRVESFYYGFGSDDFYVTVELPGNEAAAAVAMTIGGSGAVSARTIVLIEPEAIDQAIKLSPSYRAPGG